MNPVTGIQSFLTFVMSILMWIKCLNHQCDRKKTRTGSTHPNRQRYDKKMLCANQERKWICSGSFNGKINVKILKFSHGDFLFLHCEKLREFNLKKNWWSENKKSDRRVPNSLQSIISQMSNEIAMNHKTEVCRQRAGKKNRFFFFTLSFRYLVITMVTFRLRLSLSSFHEFFCLVRHAFAGSTFKCDEVKMVQFDAWYAFKLWAKSSTHDWRGQQKNPYTHTGRKREEYKKRCQFLINFSP